MCYALLIRNISGGYIQLRHLINLFLAMKDFTVISTETSITDLLFNMNYILISVPKHFTNSETSSEEKLNQDVVTTENLSGNTPPINLNETKEVLLNITDYNCLSFHIDYYDYIEIMCRVISSELWIYKAPVPSYSDGDEVNDLSETKIETESVEEVASNENITQRLEELLYDRICAWTQKFNIDSFIESSINN